jgi:epi-isozizaene 5-monooxygenase
MTSETPLRTPSLAGGAVPVLGHAWRLLRDPLEFLLSLRDAGELVAIRLGSRTAYVVCAPELVGELLTRHAQSTMVGGPLWEALADLLGEGVANTNGAVHRRQRRAIQPAFRPARMADYATIMAEEAAAMTARWRPGQVVDVFDEMFAFAVRAVTRCMLGASPTGREAGEIAVTLRTVFAEMYRRMFLPRRLPTAANHRYERALTALHHVVDGIISERRARLAGHVDLLSALLDARDEAGKPMGDKEIHDQIVAVLVAASETVASTLVWIFPLLARHPREQARLHDEVDAVMPDLPLRFDQLKQLPHTANVVVETMRLHSGAWIFTKRATADVDLGEFRIPAGADIFYSSYALQRDPRSYERPTVFDPDRWLPERAAQVPKFAMIPFGAGNRKCPGDDFAMTEAALMLATVASRWRLVPVATDLRARIGITLRPRKVLMRTEPRPDGPG